MFSVSGTKEEIIAYFKDFTKIVHKYGMIVSGDCNSELFHRLEATETDLSVFKDIRFFKDKHGNPLDMHQKLPDRHKEVGDIFRFTIRKTIIDAYLRRCNKSL